MRPRNVPSLTFTVLEGKHDVERRWYDSPLRRLGKVTTAERGEVQSDATPNNERRFASVYRRTSGQNDYSRGKSLWNLRRVRRKKRLFPSFFDFPRVWKYRYSAGVREALKQVEPIL